MGKGVTLQDFYMESAGGDDHGKARQSGPGIAPAYPAQTLLPSLAFWPGMLMFLLYGPNPDKGGNPHGPNYLLAG
jgi:hypothetical protein